MGQRDLRRLSITGAIAVVQHAIGRGKTSPVHAAGLSLDRRDLLVDLRVRGFLGIAPRKASQVEPSPHIPAARHLDQWRERDLPSSVALKNRGPGKTPVPRIQRRFTAAPRRARSVGRPFSSA